MSIEEVKEFMNNNSESVLLGTDFVQFGLILTMLFVDLVVLKPANGDNVHITYNKIKSGSKTFNLPIEEDPNFPKQDYIIARNILYTLLAISILLILGSLEGRTVWRKFRLYLQVVLVVLLCVYTHYYLKLRTHYTQGLEKSIVDNATPTHVYGLSVSLIIISIVNFYGHIKY